MIKQDRETKKRGPKPTADFVAFMRDATKESVNKFVSATGWPVGKQRAFWKAYQGLK